MKRTLILLTIIFVIAFGLYSLSNSRTFQLFGDIVHRVETNDKVVALTFDDGPWNKQLPDDVLAILDKHNVKGTFYLNGRGIRDNMRTTQKIVAKGHEIGNHGFTHKRLVFKSINTIEREITETSHLIRETGYRGKMTFRPPYFKKLFVLPYYLNKHDIVTVTGDVEADNDLFATSDDIVNSVLT
ncbi:polysaccharide deacetylase family protein [Veronia nyctiphanis]|uniref:polysaccharide deacetylase family protein n=1 Tax=Veronia nyctiphanis TaxID=1278244 RepID=UPI00191C5DD1|nr:polysaccharide deacetylase family protein [Veronia nyctiphanis]